ncbi:MAG: hypothetical protein CMH60_07940 [Myxococcales bacterium]|nr:hypothetical protein [Myxococcales bacterium]|tara:strand:- start:621 stop:1112 length:492 start_codon:yes stop_codon:yes gene_type:complete
MLHTRLLDFDIDVDISTILGKSEQSVLLCANDYLESENDKPERWKNALLKAQWEDVIKGEQDRRRAIRAPMLSSLYAESGDRMTTTNISLSGLRVSGRPIDSMMDIEFKIPGIKFPIDAKAEVVSFQESAILPIMGLRFASIDRAYLDHIADYIDGRRRQAMH